MGAAGGGAGAGAMAVVGSAAAGAVVWPLLEAVGSSVAAAEDGTGEATGAALEGDDVRPAEVGAFVVAARPQPVRDNAPPMAITIAIFLYKIPLRVWDLGKRLSQLRR